MILHCKLIDLCLEIAIKLKIFNLKKKSPKNAIIPETPNRYSANYPFSNCQKAK